MRSTDYMYALWPHQLSQKQLQQSETLEFLEKSWQLWFFCGNYRIEYILNEHLFTSLHVSSSARKRSRNTQILQTKPGKRGRWDLATILHIEIIRWLFNVLRLCHWNGTKRPTIPTSITCTVSGFHCINIHVLFSILPSTHKLSGTCTALCCKRPT